MTHKDAEASLLIRGVEETDRRVEKRLVAVERDFDVDYGCVRSHRGRVHDLEFAVRQGALGNEVEFVRVKREIQGRARAKRILIQVIGQSSVPAHLLTALMRAGGVVAL